MATLHPSDEELVAYVDGELDLAKAMSITEALADDPPLAARVNLFRTTRARLKDAFSPVMQEPVPPSLTRFVMSGGGVEPAPSITATAVARRALRTVPMAAALGGLILGASATWLALRPMSSPSWTPASLAAALETPLATLADGSSGTPAATATVALRHTVRTRAGLCRSFTLTTSGAHPYDGLACRIAGAWQVQVMAAAPEGDAFVPAGAIRPVDAFLDAAEASDPLPADEVKRLIERRWAGD